MTKTIFYDVDTQNDFMNSNGALYVPDAENLKQNLAELTRSACWNGIPIFGSVDRHFGTEEYKNKESELTKYGGPFPEHCMAGSEGQQKIKETVTSGVDYSYRLIQSFINNPLPNEQAQLSNSGLSGKEVQINETNISEVVRKFFKDIFSLNVDDKQPNYGAGIFFEKQSYDVTTNPYFDKVMDAVKADVGVVYGVATDYCVRAAVKGLANHVKQIYVVTDAIRGITKEGCDSTLKEFEELGVKFVTTKEVIGGAL